MPYSKFVLDKVSNGSAFFKLCTEGFKEVYREDSEMDSMEQQLYELECWEVAVQNVVKAKTGRSWYEIMLRNIYLSFLDQGIFVALTCIELDLLSEGIGFDLDE